MLPQRKLFIVLVLFAQTGFIRSLSNGLRYDGGQRSSNKVEIRSRRDVGQSSVKNEVSVCKQMDDQQFIKSFVNETHLNRTGNSIELAWTGKQHEKIVALTTDDKSSTLYLSSSGAGEAFQDISHLLNAMPNGSVNIIKHPNQPELVYLVSSQPGQKESTLYISTDSSSSYQAVKPRFLISTNPGFIFHPIKTEFMMAYDAINKSLYLTKDKGFTWANISSNVISAKWSQNEKNPDDIFVIVNDVAKEVFLGFFLKTNPFENTLKKSADLGKSWKFIKKGIHSFGVEGRFIYASTYLYPREDRILEVSTDDGDSWNRVRLPTVTPDMFFSILDLSNDLIFVHVDDPGDTGKGVLYTSDATGIVFSESLTNHLYPNYDDVTDFYPVRSAPGVFITSQLMEDMGIRTMITYNRGAEWEPIRRPANECQNENLPCYLQIHNAYSIKRNIIAKPPLSVPNAKGIILAHGQVADSLQMSSPDVYVSRDGGHNWHKALDGPHHYIIADNGGLLVAVPADTDKPRVVKYSANSGRCWVTQKFTEENITFTGLLTEPSNTDSVVAIWGYTDDLVWHTFVINFTGLINECQDTDYEEWTPRGHDGKPCILGRSEKNHRIREKSWCRIGRVNPHKTTSKNCKCTMEDYGCDYGYVKKDEKCVRDSKVHEVINICLRNHKDPIVPLGYHKIPGDTCVGGFIPGETQLINLNIICTDDVYLKKGSLKDEELYEKMETLKKSRSHKVIWTIILIVTIIICMPLLVWSGKKLNNKYRNVTFKYSSIRSDDVDDLDVKVGHRAMVTSLYDDISSDEDDSKESTKAPLGENHTTSDAPLTGFIHPKLFNLVASNPSTDNKVPPKDEMLALYDSDEELIK